MLAGPFLSLVIELSKLPDFVELAPEKDSAIHKREREELVTRFFAYSDGLEGYKDKPALFLFNYAKGTNGKIKDGQINIAVYRQRFLTMLAFVKRNFPLGFRKTITAATTKRVRFEAIAVGTHLAIPHARVSPTKRWTCHPGSTATSLERSLALTVRTLSGSLSRAFTLSATDC